MDYNEIYDWFKSNLSGKTQQDVRERAAIAAMQGTITIKEKLSEAIKLADAMYHAAQYLTTDASRLHKAMQDYRYFVIYELKESKL